jgi:hypothetical protein
LSIGFLLISCDKYELDDIELQLYDAYNLGDSLNFKSIYSGKIYRYVIVNRENNFHSWSDDLNGNRRWATVTCKSLDTIDNTEPNSINRIDVIVIGKSKSGTSINIQFEGFLYSTTSGLGQINNSDTLLINTSKYSDYYNLRDQTKSQNHKVYVTNLIWQIKYGIIECELNNGDIWIRNNIK